MAGVAPKNNKATAVPDTNVFVPFMFSSLKTHPTKIETAAKPVLARSRRKWIVGSMTQRRHETT
jgi:hypothetical protein